MRVAWFRANPFTPAGVADTTSAAISTLAKSIRIDVVTKSRAHDFVVEQALRPFDVCVYEARNEPGSEFIWAYLFRYPGVLVLQDRSLHDSRVRALERHRRDDDYASEFRFNHGHASRATARPFARGSWPMLRATMQASRLVVVFDGERRTALEAAYPGIKVREVPPSAAGPLDRLDRESGDSRDDVLWVSVVGTVGRAAVERAIQRAREAGVNIALAAADPRGLLTAANGAVVALDSLAGEATLAPALAAMAHGAAVIVFEREATAIWPAFDPQTWRARDPLARHEPIVVSIDPRDEEHSLMLAFRGLAQDVPRRRRLGVAARTWWLAHGTPIHAANAWRRVLEEAADTLPHERPGDWPNHLQVDGAEQARTLAADFGIALPLL